ncbi:MAG: DUF4440 domain-containing protein [Bacteroidota bacterium]|nr:MAG: DUF4440 domain-containing protein [Bacteroidota bacterium]
MKPKFLLLAILCSGVFSACQQKNLEELKAEIQQTEDGFMLELQTKGAAEAFYNYAAEDAVILRGNDSLIKGKEPIRNYYSQAIFENATAEWKPDFIEVSEDGSIAYSYGRYQWHFRDSTGNVKSWQGVYHTIWKKLPDGNWKYVWD